MSSSTTLNIPRSGKPRTVRLEGIADPMALLLIARD
jgi:hypothetical protein